MSDRGFWLGFALGALVFALAMGWAQELRLARTADGFYQRALAGALVDQVVLAEALKLGVPDPLTRALIGAQAVRSTSEKAKETKR